MRKTSTLTLALLLAGMAAPAAEFEGHLMDTMCAATRLNQAAGHTLRCIKNCSKSGFGLVTKGGGSMSASMKPVMSRRCEHSKRPRSRTIYL